MKTREWIRLIFEAFIATIIPLAISTLLQFFAIESICVNVAPSFKVHEDYITSISVQNRKSKTLSDISLYLDFDVVDVESDDFEMEALPYIKLQQLAPNKKYGAIIRSREPINSGDIIVETDCKFVISFAEEESSFWGRTARWLIIYGGIVFIATAIQLKVNAYLSKKESDRHAQSITALEAEVKNSQDQLNKLEKTITELQASGTKRKKYIVQLRIYYKAHISDLRKELDFWRDTVRKLLYESKDKVSSTENIMDTVTSTLKTYTVRQCNEDNFDEIMYIAEHLPSAEKSDNISTTK